MAAIGVALWKYTMRYAPHSPDWFNRDRFVLSNGEFESKSQATESHGLTAVQGIHAFSSTHSCTYPGTRP